MAAASQKLLSLVGVANLATRCGEAALASPGGKLLSVARLMRGGDRLVNECNWMDGICPGFLHPTWKSETFSHRHPSSVTTKYRFRDADISS